MEALACTMANLQAGGRCLPPPPQSPMGRDRPVCALRALWASLGWPLEWLLPGVSNLYQPPSKAISAFWARHRISCWRMQWLRGTCRPGRHPVEKSLYPFQSSQVPLSTLVRAASRVSFADPDRSVFCAPHSLRATVRGALRPDRGHGGHARSPPTQRACGCDGEPGSRGAPGGRVAAWHPR